MATVSSSPQSVDVSSKITVVMDQESYYYTRTSNTGTGSVSCSVSVPAGSTINSSTFSCTTTGGTLYGGTTKINGTTVSGSGPHYVGNGTSVSISVSFSFKSTATSSYTGNPKSTYTQTRTFENCVLTVDYTPPTAPSVWGVTLDGSAGTQYRGSSGGLTLNWSAQPGTNNPITSYSVHASDNGGAWYWWGSLSPGSAVTAHPTQGNSRKWLVTPVADYGNGAGVESPTVYTYSYPTAPAISIAPSSCYTGDSVTISFSGASGGTGVSINSYSLYLGNSDSALVEGITGSSYVMTAPVEAGTYTYRMKSIGSVTGYNSGYSNTVTLVVSPRQSSFTVNNAAYPNLGQLLTATISPVNSSYTHKIKWQATNDPNNYNSGGYASISAGVTTATFTPPLSWAKAEPSSPNTIGITVLLQTWNGASQVGTDAVVSFSSNIPASVKPQNPSSSGATFTPNPALPAFGGVFLVGNSKLKSTLSYSNNSYTNATSYTFIITPPTPQTQYSSTVSTPTYTTANTLSMAGTYTISAYATDARGRSSDTVAVGSIIVYGYNQPSFNITYLSREPVTSGTQFRINATVTVDKRNPPLSANAVSATHVFRAEWREKGTTTWTTANITSGTAINLGSPDIAVNKAYEVRVSAGDKVYETRLYSQIYTIPPVVRQFDFKNDRASLGKIASDTAKTFTLPDDWTTNVNADKLDGYHASELAASHDHTWINKAGQYIWNNATTARFYPAGIGVSFVRAETDGFPSYGGVTHFGSIAQEDGGNGQLYFPYNASYGGTAKLRWGLYNNAGWTPWYDIMHSGNILDKVYPVGAIYISYASTSPATLFGGTWSALPTGRFLRMGTGGATGGSDTHVHSTAAVALTVAQMASHYHDQRAAGYNYLDKMTTKLGNGGGGSETGNQVPAGSYATGGIGLGTSSTGSGAAHGHGDTGSASNVPAYYEVYAWRRTA